MSLALLVLFLLLSRGEMEGRVWQYLVSGLRDDEGAFPCSRVWITKRKE